MTILRKTVYVLSLGVLISVATLAAIGQSDTPERKTSFGFISGTDKPDTEWILSQGDSRYFIRWASITSIQETPASVYISAGSKSIRCDSVEVLRDALDRHFKPSVIEEHE